MKKTYVKSDEEYDQPSEFEDKKILAALKRRKNTRKAAYFGCA